MSLVLTLILIPILSMIFCLYIMTLYNFVTSEVTLPIIVGIIFGLIMITYLLLILITKGKTKSYKIYELEERLIAVHGYISLIYLFLFGNSLLLKSILVKADFLQFGIGILVNLIYIYSTYVYIIKRDKKTLSLVEIAKLKEKVYILSFMDDTNIYEFYTDDIKYYRENKSYVCTINLTTKKIYKIVENVEG